MKREEEEEEAEKKLFSLNSKVAIMTDNRANIHAYKPREREKKLLTYYFFETTQHKKANIYNDYLFYTYVLMPSLIIPQPTPTLKWYFVI